MNEATPVLTERGTQMEQQTAAPVRVSVTVKASRQRAWDVFTEGIGGWWPARSHSIEGEDVTAVVMDCRRGGSIVERHRDGSEANWGVIAVWEPPDRLAFSWNPSYERRPETRVEVTFTAVSESETQVVLEHRGWEALGERGAEMRREYDVGWRRVLDRYADRTSR